MALIRWEPARELHSLQQDVNRLFGSLFDAAPPAAYRGTARDWVPAMDLVEDGDDFVLKADLPGVSEDDVSIELEDGVLTISGARESKLQERTDGYHRIERVSGRFERSLTLPDGVDADGIHASFDKGVLEVRIPKPAERKRRRVAITVGEQPRVIESEERKAA
jgi:HSP20 family protein